MEIIEKKENKLFSRIEVLAKISTTDKTPLRSEVKSEIAKLLKADENLVIVSNIKSSYGGGSVSVKANVYETKEALEKNAQKHLVKRNAPAKEEEQSE